MPSRLKGKCQVVECNDKAKKGEGAVGEGKEGLTRAGMLCCELGMGGRMRLCVHSGKRFRQREGRSG